jgi:hypothetical protein
MRSARRGEVRAHIDAPPQGGRSCPTSNRWASGPPADRGPVFGEGQHDGRDITVAADRCLLAIPS